MFADGAQKRLVIPKTSTDTLRDLLGDLLSKERESQVAEQGHAQFMYEAPDIGLFRVTVTRRGPAGVPLVFDAVFLRDRGKPSAQQPPKPSALSPARAPEPFQTQGGQSEVASSRSAASFDAPEPAQDAPSIEPSRGARGPPDARRGAACERRSPPGRRAPRHPR